MRHRSAPGTRRAACRSQRKLAGLCRNALLRIAHTRTNDYTDDLIPVHHDAVGTAVVNQALESKFPYEHRIILSKPCMESRTATCVVRPEFVAADSPVRQSQLMTLIEAATTR